MIKHLALTVAIALAANPAFALSCMRPDAVRMFEYARDSDDVFYVIKGRVTPVIPYDVPKANVEAQQEDLFADTPVQISGIGLGKSGFSVPVDVGATVRLQCLSVWCGGPPADEELLMIVEKKDDALILKIGPCGSTAIRWDPASEDRLLQCHLSEKCVAAEF